MTTDDYLNLITSEYRQKPIFTAIVAINISFMVRVQELLASMIPLFDVDVAIGDQLDIIGQWAGVSRDVKIPISGVYFSWDGDDTVGWDNGVWAPNDQPTELTVLPDDAYRLLIKAKIAANHWDGTTNSAYAIWDTLFSDVTILIQDNLNMSFDLILVGDNIDSLTIALLTGGYIPLKPEGVRINSYAVSPAPVFAWDVENDLMQGWDEGNWAQEF